MLPRLFPFGFSTHQVHLNSLLKLGTEQLRLQDNILDEVYVEDMFRDVNALIESEF